MGLDEYRRKRNFQKTSEPRGKRPANPNGITAAMVKRLREKRRRPE
jgi:hypothetical protein